MCFIRGLGLDGDTGLGLTFGEGLGEVVSGGVEGLGVAVIGVGLGVVAGLGVLGSGLAELPGLRFKRPLRTTFLGETFETLKPLIPKVISEIALQLQSLSQCIPPEVERKQSRGNKPKW